MTATTATTATHFKWRVTSPGRGAGVGSIVRAAFFGMLLSTPIAAVAVEPTAPDPRGLELFTEHLRELLSHSCVRCHGAGGQGEGSLGGGLDLSTRETLLAGGDRGAAIEPGRATASLLYRLAAKLEEPHMPEEGNPLTAVQLGWLAEWIDRGAPFDKPLIVDADRTPWTTRSVDPAAADGWAFRHLPSVAVPSPADPKNWCRNAIDRFVLDRLNRSELAPAAEAPPRTLRRRLAFDLTGLPATAEEIASFCTDPGPENYQRVVDELLSRKSFGERWAQHWLDVARFAESFGYEQDYDRPHAFHYRDFVVDAFNDDLPYDTFVQWQIAGDELAPESLAARKATGFLAAGAFPTQLTEKEFESARLSEIDDMVSTVGAAMLGITVGCARCHDHKFDPVPQADYYRLAATFTGTIRSNLDLPLDARRHATAVEAWQGDLDRAIAVRSGIESQALPARFEQWLANWDSAQAPPAPAWRLGRIVSATSRVGTALVPQADGSLLAGGEAADQETYTIVIDSPLESVAALRLDALTDPSLPRGGPGRVAHGNFALSDFTVAAGPIPLGNAVGATQRQVVVRDARADYSQPSLDIRQAIDNVPTSGWAIDPQVGTAHVAVFDFAEPVVHAGGVRLTVSLDFRTNTKHSIGRPRLAVTSAAGEPAVAVTPDADPVDGRREKEARVSELAGRVSPTPAETEELHDLQRAFDTEWLAADAVVRGLEASRPQPEMVRVLVAGENLPPIPHHADDRGYPHFFKETYFLRRGDPKQPEGVAEQGFLQVLSVNGGTPAPWQRPLPPGAASSGRRAALARWLTDHESGAGSLAARVIVNRLWQHHFGQGLVATPSDFGRQGDPPSHPDLLDFLAGEFIRGGWRLKPIHQLIVSSSTYRQSSSGPGGAAADGALKIDAGNRLLWRYSRRRLDGEAIRDTLLAISGALDPVLGGRAGADDTVPRRSLYLMLKRSRPSPFLWAFDAPDRVSGMAQRPITTTAPQALLMMNSPAVRAWSERFAARIAAEPFSLFSQDNPAADHNGAEAALVQTAYARALGRSATSEELTDALVFLQRQQAKYSDDGRADAATVALADFCQVLLGLNETIHID